MSLQSVIEIICLTDVKTSITTFKNINFVNMRILRTPTSPLRLRRTESVNMKIYLRKPAVAIAKAGGGGGRGLLHFVTSTSERLLHDPIRGECQNMKPLGVH